VSTRRNQRRKFKTPQSHRASVFDAPRWLGSGRGGKYYGGRRRQALQKRGVKRLVNRLERHTVRATLIFVTPDTERRFHRRGLCSGTLCPLAVAKE